MEGRCEPTFALCRHRRDIDATPPSISSGSKTATALAPPSLAAIAAPMPAAFPA